MGFLRTERGSDDRRESDDGRERQAKSRAVRLQRKVGDLAEWAAFFEETEATFKKMYGPDYRLPQTYGNGRRAAGLNWRTRKTMKKLPEYLKAYVGFDTEANVTKDDLPPSPMVVRSALKALVRKPAVHAYAPIKCVGNIRKH